MDFDLGKLILSYDRRADERDKHEVSDWKKDLRRKFLDTLKAEGKSRLIDIGAGTGIHGLFFQENGIDVTCVDLSPAHIEKCIEKGLTSFVLNLLDMDNFTEVYDAAFALSSLLHIPTSHLPNVLTNISKILEPEGLLFWGQYGGEYREGVYQDDYHEPKRFFSLLNDEQMLEMASRNFNIESFEKVPLDNSSPEYYQALLLRVKSKG
jgi:cyclopropane fatty-acyl-phospholipid synthase-like methyltransferase